MASIIRQTAVWTGAAGLPGYSQFYHEAGGTPGERAQVGHDAVRGFFSDLGAYIPEEINVTVDPLYQVIDETTGQMVGEEAVATPSAGVQGSYVGGWNAQVGVLVEWITGEFFNGRRLRGRTYLVPFGDVSDANGTLPEATLVMIRAKVAWIALSDAEFLVWHRPVAGAGGHGSRIEGAVVRDHAALLRSRMV